MHVVTTLFMIMMSTHNFDHIFLEIESHMNVLAMIHLKKMQPHNLDSAKKRIVLCFPLVKPFQQSSIVNIFKSHRGRETREILQSYPGGGLCLAKVANNQ